jgi:hypothetical protein
MTTVEYELPDGLHGCVPPLLQDTFTEDEWEKIKRDVRQCFRDKRIREPHSCEECIYGFASVLAVLAVLVPVVIFFTVGPHCQGGWRKRDACVEPFIWSLFLIPIFFGGCSMCVCSCAKSLYGSQFKHTSLAEALDNVRQLFDSRVLLGINNIRVELGTRMTRVNVPYDQFELKTAYGHTDDFEADMRLARDHGMQRITVLTFRKMANKILQEPRRGRSADKK